ncbi:pilus assembly protein [Saprospiraceae bacterium]|nr:pilus assembly protein [Saprospiraceae bacterium]
MNKRKQNCRCLRKGVTAVEFALTFPLLLLIVFGSLEFSRANMIRNMCENAALEGARAGMIPGATAQDCTDAANSLLDIIGIQNATVTIDPSTIVPATEVVEVTVTIPLADNSLPMSKFVLGTTMSQTAQLPREVNQ